MDFSDTPEQTRFRAESRAWLKANAPWHLHADVLKLAFNGRPWSDERWLAESRAWQKKKAEGGYAGISWPVAFGGRGLGPLEDVVWREEEGPFMRLSDAFVIGCGMCAPTLMAYASEEQKRLLLPRLLSADEVWSLMLSEPGAGSDLAAVRTRAEPCEGGWKLNGQKVWTTGAHYSDWGIALVRTDPALPKHKGLTAFFLRMDSPGIRIRPIRLMNGHAEFNEVFFDDVVVPDTQRLGPAGAGWKVALTALSNERLTIGATFPLGVPELFSLAQRLSPAPIHDTDIRQRLAECHTKLIGMRFGVYRQLTALARGQNPGNEAAVGKLIAGVLGQDIAALGLDLVEEFGGSAEDALPFENMFFFAPTARLAGGADDILRNLLAEQILGLPSEPRPDRDLPFNAVR